MESPVFGLALKNCPQAYDTYMRENRQVRAFDVAEWNRGQLERDRLYRRNQ